jgi:threonylcarbamoyladenosine tRNA methylthiotransferase MtaB
VTSIARGDSQNHPIGVVVERVTRAIKPGHKEVVLCGVQLGVWGLDLALWRSLVDLVQAILETTDVSRLRFSSLKPWSLTPELLEL